MRWPKGPPHMALNPPYVFGFFFVFRFPSYTKNLLFPPKGHFCLVCSVSICFSLAFFAPPFFTFSFSVSLSLSLSLFSFFLPSYLSLLLSFGSLFWSLSFFFFLLCFCFMKRTTSKYSIAKFVFHQSFLFFWFPVLFSLSIPFFVSLFFPDFKLCFLFKINVLSFKKDKLKHIFLVKRGVAIFFFYEPVFCCKM